jgi:hypothetical protein
MAVPQDRLEALEPSNLLEPMDLTDTRPNDPDASDITFPPRMLEDRMLLDDRPEKLAAPTSPRDGRRTFRIVALAFGAAACMGIGAALSDLARTKQTDARYQNADARAVPAPPTGAVPAPASNSGAAATAADASAAKTAGGPASGNATAPPADAADQSKPHADAADQPNQASAAPAKATDQAKASEQEPAAQPLDANKKAMGASPLPTRTEQAASEGRKTRHRQASRRERAEAAAGGQDAGGQYAGPQRQAKTADADDEQLRAGDQRRSAEPSSRNEYSSSDRRSRRSHGYRSRNRDEAQSGENPDDEREGMSRAYGRENDRPYQRSPQSDRPYQRSPEFGRMFVFPGWERDW